MELLKELEQLSSNTTIINTKESDEKKTCFIKSEQKFYNLLLQGFEIDKKSEEGLKRWKKRILYLGKNEHGCPKLIIAKEKVKIY